MSCFRKLVSIFNLIFQSFIKQKYITYHQNVLMFHFTLKKKIVGFVLEDGKFHKMPSYHKFLKMLTVY